MINEVKGNIFAYVLCVKIFFGFIFPTRFKAV